MHLDLTFSRPLYACYVCLCRHFIFFPGDDDKVILKILAGTQVLPKFVYTRYKVVQLLRAFDQFAERISGKRKEGSSKINDFLSASKVSGNLINILGLVMRGRS